MKPRKILVLAANPRDTSRLRLDEEVREVEEELKRANQRAEFQVFSRWSVRSEDVQRALLDIQPQIVHFSGHGEGEAGLVLENDAGKAQLVSAASLGRLFKLFSDQVECVVLNACYSEMQADEIRKHINFVVGMNQQIGDKAAVIFATGFYRALGAGRSYEDAFEFGCNAIDLESIPEYLTPVLRRKADRKAQRVFISYRSKDPDLKLAQQLHDALAEAGHQVFMAAESIRLGDTWSQRIQQELERCDYFLLLLSQHSVNSEMVTEEIRVARTLRDVRPDHRPAILPVRVQFSLSSPLNYDQRGYLNQIQQREWFTEADTPRVVQEILRLLAEGRIPEPVKTDIDESSVKQGSSARIDAAPDHPPLPVAEPELPGGQVDIASQFYVERPPVEDKCYEAIIKPGALIRIKAPRQMGKTSLMSRMLRRAEDQEILAVPLSFQLAESSVFTDLDRLLRWLCSTVGRRLKLPNRLNDWWDDLYGIKDNCTAYFEEYLLRECDRSLALGLDEVDMVFQHPEVASDFFGLLRAWHEAAKTSKLWKKLRLIVVHSTEVYVPMNINQSPFNVGLAIELPEFTAVQVEDLATRHGLPWTSDQTSQLMEMVGGHPFLVRVALYHLARRETSLDQLLKSAPTEAGLYGDHLRRHLWNLEQRAELMTALKQVLAAPRSIQLPSVQAFQLHSIGLVDLQGNGYVAPRCNLYRHYLRDRLNIRE
ncbi:AAA-like domain-containing protein [Leptolyngbya sp. ST-U4]|uniref:AAA-like domain-containing protein n=1 Tax=Leptolyngbya sp. ST-U4 TaxID=2933912 RepID=UPI003298CBC8